MEAFLQKNFWRAEVFLQRSKWLGPYTIQYTHLECLNGSLWWRKKSTSKPCHNKEDYRARAPIFLCVWYLPISAREKEVDFIFFSFKRTTCSSSTTPIQNNESCTSTYTTPQQYNLLLLHWVSLITHILSWTFF